LKFFLFFSFGLFWILSISAQEVEKNEVGAISTDRPVQSETPTTVPKKYLQFELGGQYTTGFSKDSLIKNTVSNGNILIKYGLFENMEIRISTNYIQQNLSILDSSVFPVRDEIESTSGLSSPFMGFKFGILKEDGWKPNLSYSLQSLVPLWGNEEFQANTQNFVNRLTIGKTLVGNWFGVAGVEYGYVPDGNDHFYYVLQTGYTFFDKLTAIAEVYGYRQKNRDAIDAFNFALVYLLNDNHQIDLSGGSGLGTGFYNYYVAIGYSFRFHH